MSVGMGMDAALIVDNAVWLALAAVGACRRKIAIAYGLERALGSKRPDALRSAALLAPAGEFSFVLLPLAGTMPCFRPRRRASPWRSRR